MAFRKNLLQASSQIGQVAEGTQRLLDKFMILMMKLMTMMMIMMVMVMVMMIMMMVVMMRTR